MTLRSSDLQSDSDLNSIRNFCDVWNVFLGIAQIALDLLRFYVLNLILYQKKIIFTQLHFLRENISPKKLLLSLSRGTEPSSYIDTVHTTNDNDIFLDAWNRPKIEIIELHMAPRVLNFRLMNLLMSQVEWPEILQLVSQNKFLDLWLVGGLIVP